MNTTVVGIGSFDAIRGSPIFRSGKFEAGQHTINLNLAKSLESESQVVNFRGILRTWITICTTNGELQSVVDESIHIYDQPLLLSFNPLSRTNYKAPIPFPMFLNVGYPDGSAANGVSVNLRLELGNEYTQVTLNAISEKGVAKFDIPPLERSSGFVWFEAYIDSVNGTRLTQIYFSKFKSMFKWNSPSECHLLAIGPEYKVEPNDKGHCSDSLLKKNSNKILILSKPYVFKKTLI